MATPPRTSTTPFTTIVAVPSDNDIRIHPFKKSSKKTCEVEFSTTDKELERFNANNNIRDGDCGLN